MKRFFGFLGLVACSFLWIAGANAQATRTWVSGVGDDANPCSRTAPCKTFAGAISKTAASGEINCLDSAGFGSVTITRSIAILCQGAIGGILAAGTFGVTLNAPGLNVYLAGLDIEGAGSGTFGIRILQPASLVIEDSTIRDFRASSGIGVQIAPDSGATNVVIRNTIITNNLVGVLAEPRAAVPVKTFLKDVILTQNVRGVRANGAGGVNVGFNNVIITQNAIGLDQGGSSQLISVGNNSNFGNGTDTPAENGAFTATRPLQ